MQLPSFLPKNLVHYERTHTEKELYNALIQNPIELIQFFHYACADQTWCENHPIFIRSVLRWGAKVFYLNQLSFYDANRMVHTIQTHWLTLKTHLLFRSALFFNVSILIENKEQWVNSLLFGVSSSFCNELFRTSCFNEMRNDLTLSQVSLDNFRLIEEHILKGEISTLYRYDFSEILSLMRFAKEWGIPTLVTECASVLRRYMNKETIIETVLIAHRGFYKEWKADAYQFFNLQDWGLRFVSQKEEDLKIEFLNFKQETLEYFVKLAPYVTHLAFAEDLSENSQFEMLIAQCPKLIGVDLSGSKRYVGQFQLIPKHLLDLSLASCPWLSHYELREAATLFPYLRWLDLSNNTHLNYLAWGEISHFVRLTGICLKGCHQIVDRDLKLLTQPRFDECDLSECRGITDEGVINLTDRCKNLRSLRLDHCHSLTDNSLKEIATYALQLTDLSLVGCQQLSDQALLNLVELRSNLKFLNVSGCRFSDSTLEHIRRHFPLLSILN